MDMAIVTIETRQTAPSGQTGVVNLQYAGANNPLYIVRSADKSPFEGGKSAKGGQGDVGASGKKNLEGLEQIKPDKQPIGYEQGKDQPFTNHEIQLQKGDTIYIFCNRSRGIKNPMNN